MIFGQPIIPIVYSEINKIKIKLESKIFPSNFRNILNLFLFQIDDSFLVDTSKLKHCNE